VELKEAGVIWTYPNKCNPLDEVKITFRWNQLNGQHICFKILDGEHRIYSEIKVKSRNGEAETAIKAGSITGVHYIIALVCLPAAKTYRRCGSFRVEARTNISSSSKEIDDMFRLLKEALRQAIDIVKVKGKSVTYHKHADNSWENLAYPAFGVSSMRYFIQDMKSMFSVLYDNQWPDGRLPDHVYGDGHPGWSGKRKIRSIMADLESCMISTLYRGWQAHGDDEWVRKLIPSIEKSLRYVTTSKKTFDKKHKLIKRAHTLDEWDIQIPGGNCFLGKDTRFVLMQGDTSSMYEACGLLAELYTVLGNSNRARYWSNQQKHYYRTGNKIFWDGVKYKHHIHLDPIDHGDFDEDSQLVMSNSWAITRGFADHKKSVSIINEYMRRLRETGDRFPWWSLQPGYPDKLNYFKTTDSWSKKQGEFANGGLFPWVGGALCSGAFEHGMEKVAVKMLDDFYSVIRRDNGAVFTWYDLNGNAAINAPYNQTNYDMWGITFWFQALFEGLAGIQPQKKLFREVFCYPRWSQTGVKKVTVTAQFPASNTYFAYRYTLTGEQIKLLFTGTGKNVSFHILLPDKTQCKGAKLDGKSTKFKTRKIDLSKYIDLRAKIEGVSELILSLKR